MTTELIRFRIDPAIREKADEVCAQLGHELTDVLSAVVVRIARDGTIPFELGASAAQPPVAEIPFYNYDERLWGTMKPRIDAEVALAILARFIADCSTKLDEEASSPQSNDTLVASLTAQRDQARRQRRELDVADPVAVAAVLEAYGPLVRAGAR